MRKYKVLHVTNFLDMSGQQEDTLIAAAGLDQERYEAALAANLDGGYGFDNVLAKEARGIPHLKLHDIPSLRLYPSPIHEVRALIEMYQLIKRERFDIVHTHASKAGFLGRLAARLAGVPIIVHSVHGWPFQWPTDPASEHSDGNALPHPLGGKAQLWNRIFLTIERFAATFTDKICTLTRTLAEDGIAHKVGKADQYAVTFSGVNLERFRDVQVDEKAKRRELGLPEEGPIIGTVAVMVTRKGVDDIVRAVPKVLESYPDAHFLLVGDGEAMPALRVLVSEMGLEHKVMLTGIRRDVPELLAIMDLFVHMAWFEILPRAIIEALATGTPVVVADAGSVREIITEGVNGVLVPPRDPDTLAAELVRLLADDEHRAQLGRGAKESVFKDFTFTAENLVRTTEKVYEDLIAKKFKDERSAYVDTAAANS